MPVILRFLSVFIVIGMTACGQAEFTLTNGQTKYMSDYQGRWLLINYWAEWCKPCIEEIPQLNALDDLGHIAVLGVNFDGLLGSELKKQADTLGIGYDMIVIDPSKVLDIERPRVLPATVLIDKTGITREMLYGPQTVDSILEKLSALE